MQYNIENILSPETGESLGSMILSHQEDVDRVYDIARQAFLQWREKPAHERMFLLEKAAVGLLENKEELAVLLSAEIAKPMKDALKEVERSAEYLMFTARAFQSIEGRVVDGDKMPGFNPSQKTALVNYEPFGVVLSISPFNYPVNLAITKIAPALVAGNTVVFKPAKYGALSASKMYEILNNYLPSGVLNFISGKSSEIGDYLVTHKSVDFIAFTGSTNVGRHIQSIAKVPVYLELGGKDAAIVLSDCDLEKTVNEITKGAFSYSAQRCTAVKRVVIEDSIADEFIERLKESVSKLTLGLAKDDVNITSLIDKDSARYVLDLVKDAKDKNVKIILEGENNANLISPVILDYVNKNMRIYKEEPFGPVLPIIRVKDYEEAIVVANDSDYGLQSDVFTQDINKAFYIAKKLDVGMVQINGKSDRGPDNFPFLGIKDSGMGVAGLHDAILSMMKMKVVVINL